MSRKRHVCCLGHLFNLSEVCYCQGQCGFHNQVALRTTALATKKKKFKVKKK